MNLRNSHAGTSIVVEWFCNWVSSGVEGDEDEGWKRINVCRPFMDRLEIKVMMVRISKLDNADGFILRRRQKCCPRKLVLYLRQMVRKPDQD